MVPGLVSEELSLPLGGVESATQLTGEKHKIYHLREREACYRHKKQTRNLPLDFKMHVYHREKSIQDDKHCTIVAHQSTQH